MANTAPYEVNVTGTDDETFVFSVEFENADGSAFPFTDYAIEYSVRKGGSARLTLSEGDGITVDGSVVTFDSGQRILSRGEYQHGCRIRNLLTGKLFQVFDGSVSISEGNF